MSAASQDPFRRARPKRFAGFENICLYLVIGQFIVFTMGWFRGPEGTAKVIQLLSFDPGLFFSGEVWRAFTFVALPPFWPPPGAILGMVFLAFAWYIFYLMGSFLEEMWGARRLNLFLLTWWGFTLSASTFAHFIFGQPFAVIDTYPLKMSVFIAFAFLNPNFTLMLFFVVPVKVIWLAAFALILMAFNFIGAVANAQWGAVLAILATLANVGIFFGPRAFFLLRQRERRRRFQAGAAPPRASGKRSAAGSGSERGSAAEAFHKCAACGKTDQSHPDKDFRYVQDKDTEESRCYCRHFIQTGEKCED
ncbi:MAG: hypothetical protein ACFBZ8_01270 [Opitutales bacterium]